MSSDFMNYGESLKGLGQTDMAHDLEESSIESEDGKKIPVIQEDEASPKWRMTGFYGALDVQNREGTWNLWRRLGRNQVEAVACAQAVEMGLEMDLSTVEVEGDALSVIKKSQNNRVDKSKICAYIKDIQQLKKGFQICWFKHTSRMEDMVAHALATEGLNIFSFLF
ncbi:hypothetical protein Gotri_016074 [Gossypium trilobum]|uniref:RNase H type-1 domain-containing protein n=1 Tax=Gossypium trilobum TaxID=34281 RepID=A0A7J9E2A2_9ROSI|nr:hypothetical protein [Gossypium trilobum]